MQLLTALFLYPTWSHLAHPICGPRFVLSPDSYIQLPLHISKFHRCDRYMIPDSNPPLTTNDPILKSGLLCVSLCLSDHPSYCTVKRSVALNLFLLFPHTLLSINPSNSTLHPQTVYTSTPLLNHPIQTTHVSPRWLNWPSICANWLSTLQP